MAELTAKEKFLRDIDTMVESVKTNRDDIQNLRLTRAELAGVIENTAWCMKQLAILKKELAELEAAEAGSGGA